MFSKKLLFKQGVAAAPISYDVYGWGTTLGSTFGYRSDVVTLGGPNFPPSPYPTTTTPFNKAETERFGTLYLDISGYLWGSGVINHAAVTSSQSWSAISSGSVSFAIRNDGALFAWGSNSSGALGTPGGAGYNRSSPVQLSAAGTSWNMVRPGKVYFSGNLAPVRAIRSDGTLWGWGLNTSGQLGNGAVITTSSPVQISSSSWTTVSSDASYALAIRNDGALFAWGINGTGVVATDNTALMTTSWTQLEVGTASIYGIRSDGALFAWGRNTVGALGTGDVVGRTSPVQIGTSSWTSISAGASFAIAIRSDGTLWGWGEGGNQLGIYTPFHRSSPVQISSESWSSVSAGLSYALAIRTNGTLWGWGSNDFGQLGVGNAGSSFPRSSPVQIGTSSWTRVSAGDYHTLAIRDDSTLWAWGYNNNGQLGETTGPTYTWSKIPPASQYGDDRAAAIRSDGTLWVWGNNNIGQYGFGSVARSSPVQVGTSSWTQLATGASCTAAIRTDGALFTWGENSSGQLGLNSGAGASGQAPAQVGTDSWAQVSATGSTMFAIRSDGALFGWGHNAAGQLGLDDTTHRSSPVQVGTSSWTFVFAGQAQTAAIRSDGALFTWGNGVGGVLGQGGIIHRSSPIQVGTSSWSVVSIQDSVAAAIRSDGTLWGWGVSVPTWPSLSTRSSPVQIAAGSWTAVSCGVFGNHMLAIRNDGTLWGGGSAATVGILGEGFVRNLVWSQIGLRSWTQISLGFNVGFGITNDNLLWAWGNNNTGNLGVGDRLVHRSSPTLVGPAGTTISRSSPVQISTESWTAISAGTSFSLAIRSDSTLFAWGSNSTGQLGQTPDYEWPWKLIAMGPTSGHHAAIRADDTLWTWGVVNSNGEFGNNTTTSSTSPIQIGASSWTAVTASNGRTFAIRSDGALFAWGNNGDGDLGLGDLVHRSSPVQVGTSSWTSISSGGGSTYAIRSDGALFAWGKNQFGTLGIGLTGASNNRSSPVQIGTSSWSMVSGGLQHAYAIRSDGRLFAWGNNESGQLGVNNLVNTNSPNQIGTSSWTSISAGWGGGGFAVAIRDNQTLWTWGINTNGNLGHLDLIHRSSPVQVGLRSWTAARAVNNAAYALRSDKTIWAWGFGSTSTPLGNSLNSSMSSPTQVTTSRGTAVGPNNVFFKSLPYTTNPQATSFMALSEQNTLFVWGGNHGLGLGGVQYNAVPIIGQFRLPLSGVSSRSSPTQVGILNSWTQVFAAGGTGSVSYALRSDGSLWSWGSNAGFALQDAITPGTFAPRSFPFQVGSQSWTQIEATKYSPVSTVLAIASNGYGYIGGGSGTIGSELYNYGGPTATTIQHESLNPIGMVLNLISPNQIGTSSWMAVATSRAHAAAIRADGALFTWGADLNTTGSGLFTPDSGALGYNEQVGSRSPQQVGTSSWSQVAVGFHFTTAIRSDGRLFTWGVNREGTLGDNTTNSRSSPVQVGTSSWSAVAAGASYMAAIRSDGRLFTWGDNSDGQLGLNDLAHRSSPVQVGTSSWTQIDITFRSTFARRSDGALFAWGNNNAGLLGIGDILHRSSPVQIGGPSTFYQLFDSPVQIGTSSYAEITRGPDNTNAGIRSDGTLWTWGINSVGQLGVGDVADRSSTTQVGSGQWAKVYAGASYMLAISSTGSLWGWGDFTGGKVGEQKNTTFSWTQVAMGGDGHVLAIRSDGALFAWGASVNSFGRLGLNIASDNRSSPVQVGTSSWSLVSAGSDHSLAIRSDGGLFAWGRNNVGQVGDVTVIHRSSPVQVGTDSWSQIHASGNVSTAIRSDGALFGWGFGGTGNLGQNDILHRSSPTQIGTSSWSIVDGSSGRTFAIRSDGALFGWGLNDLGSLGLDDRIHRSSPVQVGTSSWTKVSGGVDHSLAIRSDGTMWSWGGNGAGQLGILADSSVVSWTMVSGSRTSPGGTWHAIRSDGGLFAWGNNTYGQIGDNTTSNRSSPVQIGTSSWTTVVSDAFFGAAWAIRSDGALFAWGNASDGKLGDNTGVSKSSPVQIGTSSWIAVAADGGSTAFAIRQDGGLFSWGGSFQGALGTGSGAPRSSPVQIGTSSWTAVAGRTYGAFAIRSDGRLFVWGFSGPDNGNIPTVSYSSPIFIGTSSWTSVGIGVEGTVHAIRSDGTLWGWGGNTYGQVGDETTIEKSSPVQIGTSSWNSVTTGGGVAVAIRSDGTLWSWGRGDGLAGQGSTGALFPALGDETTAHRSSPVQIGLGDSWTGVPALNRHGGAAIKNNGSLWVWGKDSSGNLGQNQTDINRSSPVQIGPNTPIALNNRSSPVQIGIGYIWNDISAGGSYSVALRADRKLFAWGQNSSGQVGDNTLFNRSSPVQIGASSWSIINAGFYNTGAIRNDSQLYVWGFGSTIGDDTVLHRSSPVVVGTIFPQVHRSSPVLVSSSSWSVASAGISHSAAIRTDGALFMWGINNNGQLGTNDSIHRSSPSQIGTSSWTTVSVGPNHTVAIRRDGTMWAWGAASVNQLGNNGGTRVAQSWSMIASRRGYGGFHVLAVRSDGGLFAWGQNNTGQLGLGDTINRSSPVQIGTSSWTMVAINSGSQGAGTSAAIRSDGGLFMWGFNGLGAVGDNTVVSKSSPVQVGTSSWTSVSVGGATYAIRSDGRLFAWGFNSQGQLGQGNDFVHRSSPVQIGTSSWTSVSASVAPWGGSSSALEVAMAIRSDNTVWVWGASYNWLTPISLQLPVNPQNSAASSPVQITSLPSTHSWIQVMSDGTRHFALNSNGDLYGWGQQPLSNFQDIFINLFNSSDLQPQSWSMVAVGLQHTLGIRSDGSLWAWGRNDTGQLGNNNSTVQRSMVQIGTSSWTSVAAGPNFSLAIRSDGALFAWGYNFDGVNGDGTTITKSSPVQIGTSSWTSVAGSQNSAFAIRSDGALFAWGNNQFGQLGQNERVSKSSPVQVGTSSWIQVTGGAVSNHAYAIRSDGALFAWGQNSSGELGVNDIVTRSSPVQIGTSSWTIVHGGDRHGGAIRSDNTVWVWGRNTDGQLGQGNRVHRSSPVQVVALGQSTFSMIAGGAQGTPGWFGVLTNNKTLVYWGSGYGGKYWPQQADQLTPVTLANANYPLTSALREGGDISAFSVSNHGEHLGAISTNGYLSMWGGGNSNGEKGRPDYENYVLDFAGPRRVGQVQIAHTPDSAGLVATGVRYFSAWGGTSAGKSALSILKTDSTYAVIGTGGIPTTNDVQANQARSSLVTMSSTRWSSISEDGLFGIDSSNLLYVWGNNLATSGTLGTNTIASAGTSSPVLVMPLNPAGFTISQSSPVQIGADRSWVAVSAGASFNIAIDAGRGLWVWGTAGLHTTSLAAPTGIPTRVGTSSSWIFVDSSLSLADSMALALLKNP